MLGLWRIGCTIFLHCLLASGAQAALHKCVDAAGKTRYSDMPCPEAEQAESQPMPGSGQARSAEMREKLESSGLHSSWFEAPQYLVDRPQCTARLCSCGSERVKLNEEPVSTLLNAMLSLPSLWQAHAAASQRWESMGQKQASFPAVRGEVENLACRVVIYQLIVADLFPTTAEGALQEHQQREQRLADIDARCKKPDESGWTQSEEAKEWVRCRDQNRAAHNEAVRQRRSTGGSARALEDATDALSQAKPAG